MQADRHTTTWPSSRSREAEDHGSINTNPNTKTKWKSPYEISIIPLDNHIRELQKSISVTTWPQLLEKSGHGGRGGVRDMAGWKAVKVARGFMWRNGIFLREGCYYQYYTTSRLSCRWRKRHRSRVIYRAPSSAKMTTVVNYVL